MALPGPSSTSLVASVALNRLSDGAALTLRATPTPLFCSGTISVSGLAARHGHRGSPNWLRTSSSKAARSSILFLRALHPSGTDVGTLPSATRRNAGGILEWVGGNDFAASMHQSYRRSSSPVSPLAAISRACITPTSFHNTAGTHSSDRSVVFQRRL